MTHYTGGTGDDPQNGTKKNDIFDYGQGGHDTLKGKGGNDIFNLGTALDRDDKIDGGTGVDTLNISTETTFTIAFRATTIANIEAINLGSGEYHFTMNNGNVAAGATLAIHGLAASALFFDGSGEADGSFSVDGSGGNDTLTGGAQADHFTVGSVSAFAGNDTIDGKAGDDIIDFGAAFTKFDKVTGGLGFDTVRLDGDYSTVNTFTSTTMTGVERIDLDLGGGSNGYNLKFHDATVAAGETLTVYANTAGNATLDGSLETNGSFNFHGGANFDDLFGGAGNDVIRGGGEADLLQGNGGADTFVYGQASDSTQANYDAIVGIDFTADKIQVLNAVTLIDPAITTGTLNNPTFDADLVARIGENQLKAHHALLYTPSMGDHAGDTFLIIDQDGTKGYDSGLDLVIFLQSPVDTAGLGAEDFITPA